MKEVLKNVYCIVVTYNGMAWIGKCLRSLMNNHYKVQVIVVDNASTDDTTAFIESHFPEVQLVKLNRNLGFGAANNIGLKMAMQQNMDHVFLLNQDAWVEADTIGELVRIQSKKPTLGIVSPLHANGRGTQLDLYFKQYLGIADIDQPLKDEPIQTRKLPELIDTEFVNAAAWLISIDCLKATGGFAPVFFHYGEDDNYAQRVLWRGFRIAVYTKARIYHDREDRIVKMNTDVAVRARKDYIIFLNQACDIRKPGFVMLWAKRTARYSLHTCLHIFDKARRSYNFRMAYHIARAAIAIRRTRWETSRADTLPYL